MRVHDYLNLTPVERKRVDNEDLHWEIASMVVGSLLALIFLELWHDMPAAAFGMLALLGIWWFIHEVKHGRSDPDPKS